MSIGQDVVGKPKRVVPDWIRSRIVPRTFRIEKAGEWVYIYSPYNAEFVESLKHDIPPDFRTWNSDEKRWEVHERFESKVRELGNTFYGLEEGTFLKHVKTHYQPQDVKYATVYRNVKTDEKMRDLFYNRSESFGISHTDRYVAAEGTIDIYIPKEGYYIKSNSHDIEDNWATSNTHTLSYGSILPLEFAEIKIVTRLTNALFDRRREDINHLSAEKFVKLVKIINHLNHAFFRVPYERQEAIIDMFMKLDLHNVEEVQNILEAMIKLGQQ